MNDVLIVGAGLGGLSAALHLASSGRKVTVLEKNPAVGGKMNWFEKNGFRFDTGPTVLILPYVLRELFHMLGETLEDHLQLIPVDPLCRYFFSDGSRLDVSSDLKKTTEQLSRFSPDDTGNFIRFLERGKEIHRAAAESFLFSQFGGWNFENVFGNLKSLFYFQKRDSFRILHQAVSATFKDPRLIRLFDRFAAFNGSSPYKTPATFAMIPYAEYAMGGWYVRGGLYSVAECLAKLAVRKGIEIRTSAVCEEILVDNGRVAGVRLADGSRLPASCVVVNADALEAYERLLPDCREKRRMIRRVEPRALSSSAFVMLLGVDKSYGHLAHYNIFFSEDGGKEAGDVFERGIPPQDPTIYLSLSSRTDPSMAPAAGSNMFVMANVPAINKSYDWNANKTVYRELILNRLKAAGLEDLENHIRVERVSTPVDFEEKYRAFRGALYGQTSHGPWFSFQRPANHSHDIKGLYFAGGSTHPGGGIPFVLLSGKITAGLLMKREPH